VLTNRSAYLYKKLKRNQWNNHSTATWTLILPDFILRISTRAMPPTLLNRSMYFNQLHHLLSLFLIAFYISDQFYIMLVQTICIAPKLHYQYLRSMLKRFHQCNSPTYNVTAWYNFFFPKQDQMLLIYYIRKRERGRKREREGYREGREEEGREGARGKERGRGK